MQRIFNITLMVLVLLHCYLSSHAQKLHYDVFLFGNKIGETTVERKDSGGVKHYTLRSYSRAKVLFVDRQSNMAADVLYDHDDNLFFSYFENIKEDEKILTQIHKDKEVLHIDKNGEKKNLKEPVKHSSLKLYFNEPKHIERIFSERMGEYFDIHQKSEGVYKATLDGLNATYIYRAGKLMEIEMTKGFIGTVYMKLVH